MKFLLLLLTLFGAFASTPVEKKKQPAAAATSDAAIENAIRARFAKSKIASNNLQVHVRGGVATIEGQVSVVQHKGAATRMAKTAGATKVVNNIRIDEAAKRKAAGQLERARKATIQRSSQKN